ncbi:hypothetical protein BaRGS_00014269 [Batillaria attramentaria]|uniref:Uncharacterized protein n=1 Tax=Batillaria attramentaria TaxID=370345 RepID=A0ABD0L4X8_9CAEN
MRSTLVDGSAETLRFALQATPRNAVPDSVRQDFAVTWPIDQRIPSFARERKSRLFEASSACRAFRTDPTEKIWYLNAARSLATLLTVQVECSFVTVFPPSSFTQRAFGVDLTEEIWYARRLGHIVDSSGFFGSNERDTYRFLI